MNVKFVDMAIWKGVERRSSMVRERSKRINTSSCLRSADDQVLLLGPKRTIQDLRVGLNVGGVDPTLCESRVLVLVIHCSSTFEWQVEMG